MHPYNRAMATTKPQQNLSSDNPFQYVGDAFRYLAEHLNHESITPKLYALADDLDTAAGVVRTVADDLP